MTDPAKRTQPQDRDERERPAATAMSDQECAAIRQPDADDARRSRTRQGLPERIEDPAAVAVIAAILRDTPHPTTGRKHRSSEASSINQRAAAERNQYGSVSVTDSSSRAAVSKPASSFCNSLANAKHV
jgi:hypothetical protein